MNDKLIFIILLGILAKFLAYKKNVQVLINVLLVGSVYYFWYVPTKKRQEKEEVASFELLEEFDKLKEFEGDIGSSVGIDHIKEILGHFAIDKYYDGNNKQELQNIADLLQTIRNELNSMKLSIEDNDRLLEFTDLAHKLMDTLTKNYATKIYNYNIQNLYNQIEFNGPAESNGFIDKDNMFLSLLKDKTPSK